MESKKKYLEFENKIYIPIFSKSWWLDETCGVDNWYVWIYEKGGEVVAAMPYFMEARGKYTYITKPILTQNNGILIKYPMEMKRASKQAFEEEVINAACQYIDELGVDVYEQQFHYSFYNCLPFLWNSFAAIPRYTYVIEDTKVINKIFDEFSSKQRSIIRKGEQNCKISENITREIFYEEHRKVFLKQHLSVPFSESLWNRLYDRCLEHHCGKILYAETADGNIASILYLVWDEKSMYHLIGGSIPEYQNLDTYSALTWYAIQLAAAMGLKYDFEGSVIKRIAKAFREFGGEPKLYFRIRKVYHKEIIQSEAEASIWNLAKR